jgi:hypothetical protein
VVDGQPELGRGDAEAGGRRRHAQVAGDRQLRARPQSGPVTGGHDGTGIVTEGPEEPAEEVGERAVLHPREVRARAEVASGAGEHDHPRARRPGVRVEQLLECLVVEGVASLRAVDRDEGDRPAVVEVDHAAEHYRAA